WRQRDIQGFAERVQVHADPADHGVALALDVLPADLAQRRFNGFDGMRARQDLLMERGKRERHRGTPSTWMTIPYTQQSSRWQICLPLQASPSGQIQTRHLVPRRLRKLPRHMGADEPAAVGGDQLVAAVIAA